MAHDLSSPNHHALLVAKTSSGPCCKGRRSFCSSNCLRASASFVRASLGPIKCLLARMLAYVTNEKELDVHTVKNLVAEARGDRTKSGKNLYSALVASQCLCSSASHQSKWSEAEPYEYQN